MGVPGFEEPVVEAASAGASSILQEGQVLKGLRLRGFTVRPLINKPPPLNRDYNQDPSIKGLKRSFFCFNEGST